MAPERYAVERIGRSREIIMPPSNYVPKPAEAGGQVPAQPHDAGRQSRSSAKNLSEHLMATKKHGVTLETPTEARQTEPGPSVLWLLVASTVLAVSILGFVWLMFFQT